MTTPDLDHALETRVLPHNLEAERSLLGAILIENGGIEQAQEIVSADDFYREGHRTIFRTLAALIAKDGASDLITLTEELDSEGKLEDVGGAPYVSSLVDGVPRSANVAHYARIVREKSVLREFAGIGAYAMDLNGDGSEALLARARPAMERLENLSARRLPALDGAELEARIRKPEKEATALIEGLLEVGAASLGSGAPKSWKTTKAADAGLCVASGRRFADHFETVQAPFLHVDAEMGERRSLALYRRLALGEEIDLPRLASDGLLFYLDATRPGPTREPRSIARFVRERGIGLVLLDPVVALFTGDENAATDVRTWWGTFVRPILDEGAAALILHHTRKGSPLFADTASDSTRGSGDWRGAPDLHFAMRCEAGDHRLVRIEVTGSRLGPEPDPFLLRVEDHEGGTRIRFAGDVQSAIGKTAAAANEIEGLLDRAGDGEIPRKDILAALADRYASRTLSDALALCKERGSVNSRRDGMGVVYRRIRA